MDPGDPWPRPPGTARPASAAAGASAAACPPPPLPPSVSASAPLCEIFDAEADLDPRLAWVNRPAAATFSPATGLRIVPLPTADWWANTGRQPRAAAADGAFLGALFTGAFDATASFIMHHRQVWDQAGLMLHAGPDCWLKINAERVEGGGLVLATAVTNAGWTDLSTFPLSADDAGGGEGGITSRLMFRIRRTSDGDLALAWAPGDGASAGGELALSPRPAWRRVRLAHLHADPVSPVRVGPYAVAPSRAGFIANVRWFRVDAARGGVTED